MRPKQSCKIFEKVSFQELPTPNRMEILWIVSPLLESNNETHEFPRFDAEELLSTFRAVLDPVHPLPHERVSIPMTGTCVSGSGIRLTIALLLSSVQFYRLTTVLNRSEGRDRLF
jgi:hypothetical protein